MAFLLRLWQVTTNDGHLVWRATLENPHTEERWGFASLEDLLVYLNESASDATAVPGGMAPPANDEP